ncbi:hypothetical protein BS78_05G232000 [Paspalum vaginatum]|nr:hypothetical protein BS78_05G232000 [Paspalum vaginatum]
MEASTLLRALASTALPSLAPPAPARRVPTARGPSRDPIGPPLTYRAPHLFPRSRARRHPNPGLAGPACSLLARPRPRFSEAWLRRGHRDPTAARPVVGGEARRCRAPGFSCRILILLLAQVVRTAPNLAAAAAAHRLGAHPRPAPHRPPRPRHNRRSPPHRARIASTRRAPLAPIPERGHCSQSDLLALKSPQPPGDPISSRSAGHHRRRPIQSSVPARSCPLASRRRRRITARGRNLAAACRAPARLLLQVAQPPPGCCSRLSKDDQCAILIWPAVHDCWLRQDPCQVI